MVNYDKLLNLLNIHNNHKNYFKKEKYLNKPKYF